MFALGNRSVTFQAARSRSHQVEMNKKFPKSTTYGPTTSSNTSKRTSTSRQITKSRIEHNLERSKCSLIFEDHFILKEDIFIQNSELQQAFQAWFTSNIPPANRLLIVASHGQRNSTLSSKLVLIVPRRRQRS